jgi:hypothetical protein
VLRTVHWCLDKNDIPPLARIVKGIGSVEGTEMEGMVDFKR